MKFGVRKPSIKRSIKARTTGRIKRSIKKSVNPLYGKKGMGYINNPKKAVYNKVYNKTTVSMKDMLGFNTRKHSSSTPPKKHTGLSLAIVSVLLIIFGVFTLPFGLILIAVGICLFVAKRHRNANAPQDDQQGEPADISAPDPTPYQPNPSVDEVPKKKTERHHVAGESYHKDEIISLMWENPCYSYSKKELIDNECVDERVYKLRPYLGAAELVPEPENPHDPKAVKVMVEGTHIGYIKAGSCARIHKLLREDGIEKVEVEIKGGDYKIVYGDFDDYTEKSTYTMEHDTVAIGAVITLTLK